MNAKRAVGLVAAIVIAFVSAPFSQSANAATAKIVGPTGAAPGDLVVLTASESAGKSYAWTCVPATNNMLVVDGGERFILSSAAEKTYVIVLAVADADGSVAVTQHTVAIGTAPPSPGPEPGPPSPGPGPPTPTPLPELGEKARQWKSLVTDPAKGATAKSLAGSFRSIAAAIAAGVLTRPEDIVRATLESNYVALGGKGSATHAAWQPFFSALNLELNTRSQAGMLKTPESHRQAWVDLAAGLER